MTSAELCQAIYAAGMTVRADGDALVVKPAERLTPELRATVLAHKPELLDFLLEAHATTEALLETAARACDHWGDSPAARQQMRQEIEDTPAHLRADLLDHLRSAYPKEPR
ncbi:hypothetical protein [Hydrogenophaga sp. BPS33]|uniref:TubC N-terminal docking domain-related protein n=1 Tax=Hydrogenophaga sp. BPS33 TaxID=2651974 RepID=UPI00131F9376|nr:hypothetical protein [Hydrogenophaga sp. BPS33]QHE86520.1 hypothetical protein F9K07_17240 [Hydrogenophaga sp. BPS33]